MVDQNLLNYVKQQMHSGYDSEAIKKALISQGWDEKEVSEGINNARLQNVSSGHIQNQHPNQVKNNTNKNQLVNMTNPKYAGFWIRVVALFIDGIISGIIFYPIYLFLISKELGSGSIDVTSITSPVVTASSLFSIMFGFCYLIFNILMDGKVGGTPGKLIIGIRIVKENGERIGIAGAIIRYIGKIISSLIICIGYLMIAFDSKKQGLHDKIANTFVVYAK